MANGYLRLADEYAPNGELGANAVSSLAFDIPFLEAFVDPKPSYVNRDGEVLGVTGPPSAQAVSGYAPEGSIKAAARPSYLGLMLKEAIGGVTSTPGDASAVLDPDAVPVPYGAHRHAFAWCTGVTPHTMQALFSALTGPHWIAKGNGIETLGLAFEDEVLMATAALRTLYADTQADPSITPAITTEHPFFSGSMSLSWLAGSAVTEDFNFEIRNSLNFFRSFLGAASKYPDTAELGEDMPSQRLGGTVAKRSLDADDYAALKACSTFAAIIKLVHSQTIKRLAVAVASSSVAASSVITCSAPHHLPTGTSTVVIAGHTGSTPDINGTHVATKVDPTTFSIPVNVSVGGTGGTVVSDTAYTHKLWVTMPACQYTPDWSPETIQNKRQQKASFPWEAKYDPTTAKWAEIVLVNDVPAYYVAP